MHWIPRILACLLVTVGGSALHAGEPVVLGQTEHLHSAVLDEARTYHVALPASYKWATDRRYPVLYVLDGASHFQHTAASVGYLAAHGEIPEMIVVAIDSTKRVRDFTQTDWPAGWIGGGGAANFRRFLSTELMPAIDRTYRTDGFRVLSGHSAGGQFALYCLTDDPSLFRGYIALSPSLDWDGNLPLLAQIDGLRHLYSGYRLHDDLLDKGFAFAQAHFQAVSKTVGWTLPVPEGIVNDLGYAALEKGLTAEALELFRRNVEANPSSANAYDGLADGYAKAEEWREAAAAAARAEQLAEEQDHPNRVYFSQQARKMADRLKQAAEKPN